MNELISIVVPVYRVERYLEKCIKSILAQSYTNIEIILIDDCSPDSCGDICDKYALQDSRIKVVHHVVNQGLSAARNTGTAVANGKYITYIDSDDVITLDYVEYLYRLLIESDADISVCRILDCDEQLVGKSDTKKEEFLFTPEKALQIMLYQNEFTTSASGKLYPVNIMRKLQYPVGRLYEDLFTTYRVLASVNRIAYGQRQLYYYIHREDSIMTSSFSMKRFDVKDAIDNVCWFIQKKYPQIMAAAVSRRFSCYSQLYGVSYMATGIDKERENLWQQMRTDASIVVLDENCRLKNRIAALIVLVGIRSLFLAMYKLK